MKAAHLPDQLSAVDAMFCSGVELAAVMADPDRACLVLETGVNERFRYGRYRRTPESTAEAQAWEEAKRGVKCDFVTMA